MTPKMKKLLDFISAQIDEHGLASTFDDMVSHMGLKSKSGIHRMLTALEDKGKIARMHGRARSIAIVSANNHVNAKIAFDVAKTNLRAKTTLNQIASDMENGLISHKHAAHRIRQIVRIIQL